MIVAILHRNNSYPKLEGLKYLLLIFRISVFQPFSYFFKATYKIVFPCPNTKSLANVGETPYMGYVIFVELRFGHPGQRVAVGVWPDLPYVARIQPCGLLAL